MRALYVGMKPAAAYVSMRSGRIPSEEKKIACSVLGLLLGGLAADAGIGSIDRSNDRMVKRTGVRNRALRVTGHLHD